MLDAADIVRDLARLTLWVKDEDVAAAAVRLLEIYREVTPLGQRLLTLPKAWAPAYEEVLLLLRHLAENLGSLRPEARLILRAFGGDTGGATLPDLSPADLLARMIEHLDHLEPVAALPDSDRSLFSLHMAEVAGEAEEVTRLEAWLLDREDRPKYTPAFLWRLGASVDHNLARSHIFDRSKGEHGLLSIIDRLMAAPEE